MQNLAIIDQNKVVTGGGGVLKGLFVKSQRRVLLIFKSRGRLKLYSVMASVNILQENLSFFLNQPFLSKGKYFIFPPPREEKMT